jgi:hypothetical protein
MTKAMKSLSMKSLLVLVAVGVSVPAGASGALAADSCPNEQLRIENHSTALADCRAYELVSPDRNHAGALPALSGGAAGLAGPTGDMMVYQALDAPDNAKSAQGLSNYVRATRDTVRGWAGTSLSPPVTTPVTAYTSITTLRLSDDLSSTFEATDQPLSGGAVPSGKNLFVGRPDGTYHLVTAIGTPIFGGLNAYPNSTLSGSTPDFSHVFFEPTLAQLPLIDPLAQNNTYSWSEGGGLRLVGILPNGTPAPSGARLASVSDDGRYVAFTAEGELYLRVDEDHTVRVGVSQRTVNPDPNPPSEPTSVKVTANGAKILFTSSSELTNDANTGESGGAANDAGRDVYSYDTATGKLTDLTVDTNPADAATGANVLQVLNATSDASYVYFLSRSGLAEGAAPGHTSLYVWHGGGIAFVADMSGLVRDLSSGAPSFYMAPDGRHVTFGSTDSLTGYDNRDPVNGQPHAEVFEAGIDSGLECASCRPDGTRPTANSVLQASPLGRVRVMSDDGRYVFFQTTDAVVPQATSGHQQVFEYTNGTVAPISRVDGTLSWFLDASASGNDVFVSTYDELVANPNGGDAAVYDARVGGGFPVPTSEACSGAACHAVATLPPALPVAATLSFSDRIEPAGTSATPPATLKVTVSKIKAVAGTVASIKLQVPGDGGLTVSGAGLKTVRLHSSAAQALAVRLALTGSAAKTLQKRRKLTTTVKVNFDANGQSSSTRFSLTFKAKSTRGGR